MEGRKAIQLPLARSFGVRSPEMAGQSNRPTTIQAQAWHSAWRRRRLAFGCQIDMIVELANWNWLGSKGEGRGERRGRDRHDGRRSMKLIGVVGVSDKIANSTLKYYVAPYVFLVPSPTFSPNLQHDLSHLGDMSAF